MSEQSKEKPVTEADILALPSPPELVRFERMAQIMIDNNMYSNDKKKSKQMLKEELELKLYHCDQLGIPATFANSLYFVNGKVTCMVDLMNFLVKQKCPNIGIRVTEYEADRCTILFRRDITDKESPWVMIHWNIERAKKMGLTNKPIWQNDSMEMLRARCYSEGYRAIAGDALGGLQYTREELELK